MLSLSTGCGAIGRGSRKSRLAADAAFKASQIGFSRQYVYVGMFPSLRSRALPTISPKLYPRPPWQSQDASETVRALLFCRLTPLLILNALPPAALLSEDQQEQTMSMEFSKEHFHVSGVGSRRQGSPVAGWSGPTKAGPPPCRLGACLEEIRALLLERTEQLYEYDQV